MSVHGSQKRISVKVMLLTELIAVGPENLARQIHCVGKCRDFKCLDHRPSEMLSSKDLWA
jgi:hypothetical protein